MNTKLLGSYSSSIQSDHSPVPLIIHNEGLAGVAGTPPKLCTLWQVQLGLVLTWIWDTARVTQPASGSGTSVTDKDSDNYVLQSLS